MSNDYTTTLEIWKPIPNTNGKYEASNMGRIRKKIATKYTINYPYKIMKQSAFPGKKYMRVSISIGGVSKSMRVHRLVLMAFVGMPPKPDYEVNHKNGDKQDNRLDNLEWVTMLENKRHAVETGLYATAGTRGVNNQNARLTESDVLKIRELRAAGMRYKEIAAMFDISIGHARQIVHRRAWQHLN